MQCWIDLFLASYSARSEPGNPAVSDRQHLGVATLPFAQVVKRVVETHLGPDNRELLIHQFVIANELVLRLLSFSCHRMFRAYDPHCTLRPAMTFNEIKQPPCVIRLLLGFAHDLEE